MLTLLLTAQLRWGDIMIHHKSKTHRVQSVFLSFSLMFSNFHRFVFLYHSKYTYEPIFFDPISLQIFRGTFCNQDSLLFSLSQTVLKPWPVLHCNMLVTVWYKFKVLLYEEVIVPFCKAAISNKVFSSVIYYSKF